MLKRPFYRCSASSMSSSRGARSAPPSPQGMTDPAQLRAGSGAALARDPAYTRSPSLGRNLRLIAISFGVNPFRKAQVRDDMEPGGRGGRSWSRGWRRSRGSGGSSHSGNRRSTRRVDDPGFTRRRPGRASGYPPRAATTRARTPLLRVWLHTPTPSPQRPGRPRRPGPRSRA